MEGIFSRFLLRMSCKRKPLQFHTITFDPGGILLQDEAYPEEVITEEQSSPDETVHNGQVDQVSVINTLPPVPPLRTSVRTRKTPEWTQSGEFFVSQLEQSSTCSSPDWKKQQQHICNL